MTTLAQNPISIDLHPRWVRETLVECFSGLLANLAECVGNTMDDAPEIPYVVNIIDDASGTLSALFTDYIGDMGKYVVALEMLADESANTFDWKLGRELLIERLESVSKGTREYYAEAPTDLFGTLAEVVGCVDAMLTEYAKSDAAGGTAKAEIPAMCPLPFEDAAAIHRTIESYLLGWGLENGVEEQLGITGKLNVPAFTDLGGRFALVGRILEAVQAHGYPTDQAAVCFLDELIEDSAKDTENPLDTTDKLLVESRREWLRLAKITLYRFSGREDGSLT